MIRGLRKRRSLPTLKSEADLHKMREAGRLVHRILDRLVEMARPGVTTGEMDAVASGMIADAGADALFRGQTHTEARFPFPAALCTSVNDVVVHGIPGERRLCEGDIVSVDCGVRLHGLCGDAARTYAVGRVDGRARALLDVTLAALDLAVNEIRPGRWWGEIAGQIQKLVEDAGFSVVRQFVGHGIGREMWEEPKVPNYVDRKARREDFLLKTGMTIAVEPMVAMGAPDVKYADPSNWAVVTADGSWAAHFEHTVAVGPHGADVLTDGR